jgi:hypothetical protein
MGVCILGMGDCNSSTSSDISNITDNNTEINNSIRNQINQDCNQLLGSSNTINIVGSTVKKLSTSQKNSVQSMCIMQSILKSQTSADVVNKLLGQIKNNLESKGALLGSPASNNSVVKNITTNKTKIDNSKFNDVSKKCILDLNQSNLLNIIGSNVEDTTTDQANEGFLKCMSAHSDDTEITAANLADTQQAAESTSKTAGGDVAKSLGEGISTAAQGVGTGAASWITSFTYPIMFALIAIICLSSLSVILSLFISSNPQASQSTQQFAKLAADLYKNKGTS